MNRYKKDSTVASTVTCAIIFFIFTFLYIYCYQTPTLSFAQHVLSGGATFYHPLISAIIITVVAYVIQLVTFRIIKLKGASHALTYLPSMLFLCFLTCPRPDGHGGMTVGKWIWFVPLILILYGILIKVIKQWIGNNVSNDRFLSSRILTVNLITMILMAIYTVNIGNGDPIFHRQVWAEKLLIEKKYQELAHEGSKTNQLFRQTGLKIFASHNDDAIQLETDSTLTLLRFIALSKLGTLADSLFTQPVVGGTASLLYQKNIHPYLFSSKFLSRTKDINYRLCAFLVEGDLDSFAKMLQKNCNVNDTTARDSLPRHYKEALVLYQHMRSNPVTAYVDTVLETDYSDMTRMRRESKNRKEEDLNMWRSYRNTYWYYYMTRKQ